MSKHKFLIIKYNLIYNYPKNILLPFCYLLIPIIFYLHSNFKSQILLSNQWS